MDPISLITSFIGGALGQQAGRHLGPIVDYAIENCTESGRNKRFYSLILENNFCITSQQARQYFTILRSGDNEERLKAIKALEKAGLHPSRPRNIVNHIFLSLLLGTKPVTTNDSHTAIQPNYDPFLPQDPSPSQPPPVTFGNHRSHPACLKIFRDDE